MRRTAAGPLVLVIDTSWLEDGSSGPCSADTTRRAGTRGIRRIAPAAIAQSPPLGIPARTALPAERHSAGLEASPSARPGPGRAEVDTAPAAPQTAGPRSPVNHSSALQSVSAAVPGLESSRPTASSGHLHQRSARWPGLACDARYPPGHQPKPQDLHRDKRSDRASVSRSLPTSPSHG